MSPGACLFATEPSRSSSPCASSIISIFRRSGGAPPGDSAGPVPGGPRPSHRPAQERLEADFEPQSQAEAGKIKYGLADIRNTSLGRRPVSNKDQRMGFLSTRALPEAIKRALLA